MPVGETDYAKVGGKATIRGYSGVFLIFCEISQGEKINDNCFGISVTDMKTLHKEYCKREHKMR